MNTGTESGEPSQPEQAEKDEFNVPESDNDFGRGVFSSNIAILESDLDCEREQRKEERFYWICAIVILIDGLIYHAMQGFWAFLLIFMLQLIALSGIAKMLGVDWAVQVIGWFLHWISERAKLPGKD